MKAFVFTSKNLNRVATIIAVSELQARSYLTDENCFTLIETFELTLGEGFNLKINI